VSFDRKIEVTETHFRVSAYCFEGESNIRFFDTGLVKLSKPIESEKSKQKWVGESWAQLTLKKPDGPSFQKYLLDDIEKEAKELMVWWDMRDKYIEELEEYMEGGSSDGDAKEYEN